MADERQDYIRAAGHKSINAMAWLRDHELPAEPVCYTVAYEYLFTENKELITYIDKVDLTQQNYKEILEQAYRQLSTIKNVSALSNSKGLAGQHTAEILSLLVGKLQNNEDHAEALRNAKEELISIDASDGYTTINELGAENYIQVKNNESLDELTQVLDKNGLMNTMSEAIKHPENYPMAVIHMDIDLFGQFNKVNGQTMGNAALKNMAKILSNSFRGSDIVSRGEQDSFILVLPKTPAVKGSELSEVIRKKIASITLKKKNSPLVAKMTISVGVTELKVGNQFDDALIKADKALFRSIDQGRNCVNRVD